MREQTLPLRPTEEPRLRPGDWLAELRQILFDGAGPAESRIEQLLDRMERR
jgi:hypothetical protein